MKAPRVGLEPTTLRGVRPETPSLDPQERGEVRDLCLRQPDVEAGVVNSCPGKISPSITVESPVHVRDRGTWSHDREDRFQPRGAEAALRPAGCPICLLYTSDAADE